MNRDEIFEEIRTLLREPQIGVVETPWQMNDSELLKQCKSALRHLRAKGLPLPTVLTPEGEFDPPPSETDGLLIALFCAYRYLSGGLIQRLMDGELGIYFKAGADVIDTQAVARHFMSFSNQYRRDFDIALAVALSNLDSGNANVYGGPTPYNRNEATDV